MKVRAQNSAQLLAGASALVGTLAGLALAFLALDFGQEHADASSATVVVFATTKVMPSITTQKRSDFIFQEEEPGASEETISATDTTHAASLIVSGVGHQAYALSLPHQVLLRNLRNRRFSPIIVDNLHSDLPYDLGYLGNEGHES